MKSIRRANAKVNRRTFIRQGVAGLGAAASVFSISLPAPAATAAITKAVVDPYRGLKVGVASYSLRKFKLDEALSMTRAMGVKYITLKDFHLPFKTSKAEREEARRKTEAAGITLLGGGVIYMKNDEQEIRSMFEYAREAGMPTIVAAPDPAGLDLVEKMAKEFNIRVAIHNHGPGDQRYPSPLDVLKLIQDRHELLGVCIDVGHTIRLGQDPVEVTRRCASRLHDFHIKDVTRADPSGKAIELGRGVIDLVGLMKVLLELKFPYHVALEHELSADNPIPGMVESFAYLRGILAAL